MGRPSGPTEIRTSKTPRSFRRGEQDYLQPSDRVFGVSINGEHRRTPPVNAHEMANDVLGGEAIALAY